jgi:hypothetical protein
MFGTIIDSQVVLLLLEDRIPDLFNHISSIPDLDLTVVLTRWLVCILALEVPKEVSLRIWDLFLLKGPKIIFRTILAIFQLMKKSLMKLTDQAEFYMKVTNFPAEELDIKNVFALLDDHKFRVTN